MNWLAELRQVEAWVQREVQAEERLTAALSNHRDELASAAAAAIQAGSEALAELARGREGRLSELRQLFERIGRAVGVRGSTLSLGSLVERAGPEGERLARLRGELLRAHQAGRKALLDALAIGRAQGQVLRAVLVELLGVDPLTEPERAAGRFVEVRA